MLVLCLLSKDLMEYVVDVGMKLMILLQGEDGAGPNVMPSGGGGFEFGVDPNEDPELALALRVSMEEQRARQQERTDRFDASFDIRNPNIFLSSIYDQRNLN